MPSNVNENIIQQLKQLNIYDSISEIYIKNGRASCCIELPQELTLKINQLQKKTEQILLGIKGVQTANVTFTLVRKEEAKIKQPSHSPIAKDIKRLNAQKPAAVKKNFPKRIIAVASGKGGVGKSTCAVNIAKALSCLNLKIGLLDLDVYGPSIPHLMKAESKYPTSTIINGKKTILPLIVDGLELMSIGFFIKPEAVVAWRGHMASSFVKQMLADVKWGELDFLIIDLPPGTGDIQLTLAQNINLSGAVIISTPHELALLDVRRCIDMFRKIKVPILGLIENMSYFKAPDTGNIYHIFGKKGATLEASEQGIELLSQLPLVDNIALFENTDYYKKIAQTLLEKL